MDASAATATEPDLGSAAIDEALRRRWGAILANDR
jgi:hypothetical protein